jgi:hypothetical protein
MADPFLLAHYLEPLIFDIGGPLAPISIRDQMFRARTFVQRARTAGYLTPDSEFLVVGAGAAGVSAAIDAARAGVKTYLIDSAGAAFVRQRNCATRWLDPTQYDWPDSSYAVGRWPVRRPPPPPLPLDHPASYAQTLGNEWASTLSMARASLGSLLGVQFNTEPAAWPRQIWSTSSPAVATALDVDLRRGGLGGTVYTRRLSLILFARGFGTERCSVFDPDPLHGGAPTYGPAPASFTSLNFWDTDQLQDRSFTISNLGRILISGAGDGGLQDFIRLTTGIRSASRMLRRMESQIAGFKTAMAEIAQRLSQEERRAQRALLWSADGRSDHPVLVRLHAAHDAAVSRLQSDPSLWTRISKWLYERTYFRSFANFKLACPCSHFSGCYSLNQFLTVLILRYLKLVGHDVVQFGQRVVRVDPVAHSCAIGCTARDHAVTFADWSCMGPGALAPTTSTFQAIVIRHGITPPFSPPHSRIVRQTLPIDPPW